MFDHTNSINTPQTLQIQQQQLLSVATPTPILIHNHLLSTQKFKEAMDINSISSRPNFKLDNADQQYTFKALKNEALFKHNYHDILNNSIFEGSTTKRTTLI